MNFITGYWIWRRKKFQKNLIRKNILTSCVKLGRTRDASSRRRWTGKCSRIIPTYMRVNRTNFILRFQTRSSSNKTQRQYK